MRIAVEIGLSERPGGARRVALSIVREMARLAPHHEFVCCTDGAAFELGSANARTLVCRRPAWQPPRFWAHVGFAQVVLPRLLGRLQPAVTLYTNNSLPVLMPAGANAVLLYDMAPYVLPESFTFLQNLHQRWCFRRVVRHAGQIVTISDFSKAEICRILEVPEQRVSVNPLGVWPELAVAEPADAAALNARFGVRPPYILYVGAVHPRKNVGGLIAAFAELKTRHGLPHSLVVAGQLRWKSGDIAAAAAAVDLPPGSLVLTGKVTDAELVGLYRYADLFVYPSFYEGFGLPVLEAMAMGVPVVTSNAASLPEVAGDAAVFVRPEDPADIARGMLRVLRDPELAASLRQRGRERAAQFSWEKTATRMLAVLERLVAPADSARRPAPGAVPGTE